MSGLRHKRFFTFKVFQHRYIKFINVLTDYIIQGDSYSFINVLTSGRFRSQKALDNKILSHTSKIGKNYHIGFFTIGILR
jgi:hypothetical protein